MGLLTSVQMPWIFYVVRNEEVMFLVQSGIGTLESKHANNKKAMHKATRRTTF
jgi:hypothetical protein